MYHTSGRCRHDKIYRLFYMKENNQKKIFKLVDKLPEIYQPIFGHQEITLNVSRRCDDRLSYIKDIYILASNKFGRPLRVLDLGSSQGYFCFNLAELGAIVHGVDFSKENIDVCNALATEYSELKVSFETAYIEDFINKIKKDEYDLVLGLSVFHHIIHKQGIDIVKSLFKVISEKIPIGIFEIALAEEPLYWGLSQYNNPRDLLSEYAFVHEIGRNKTHLSEISRPLYVASNSYWVLNNQIGFFKTWKNESHSLAGDIHKNTRRYFFGEGLFVKLYLVGEDKESGLIQKKNENLIEYKNEVDFLSSNNLLFRLPKLLSYATNNNEAWLIREELKGSLLSEIIQSNKVYSEIKVLDDILFQLTEIEKFCLYHNDLRTWNVIIDSEGHAHLIDYGSITKNPTDCIWPQNIFISFLIFMHEVLNHKSANLDISRFPLVSPLDLKEPYRSVFIYIFSRPIDELNFKNIRRIIFDNKFKSVDTDLIPASVLTVQIFQDRITELMEQLIQNVKHINLIDARLNLREVEFKLLKDKLNLSESETNLAKNDLALARDKNSLLLTELVSLRDRLESEKAISNSFKLHLDSKVVELSNVYSSRAWRVVGVLSKILIFLFPQGSLKRRLAVKITKLFVKIIRKLIKLFYQFARKSKKILIVFKHSMDRPQDYKDLDNLSPRTLEFYQELKTIIKNNNKSKSNNMNIITRIKEVWKSYFVKPDCKEIFGKVYRDNLWGGSKGDFYSGPGSHEDYIIEPYINMVVDFLEKEWNNKSRVVDLGCGDFYIGSHLINHCSEYVACDVVPDLIEKLKSNGYPSFVKFRYLDITKHDLPEGDVCFVRQVLQHLSNKQIVVVLSKLKKYKTVFITEHYPNDISKTEPNKNIITGSEYRVSINSAVFLDKPPFNVPAESLKLMLEIQDIKHGGIIRTYKLEF
jgi:2-polyprenyl-3-methyl-5-hydroxy-6-metoxy-1,4-benzoquinol methylase